MMIPVAVRGPARDTELREGGCPAVAVEPTGAGIGDQLPEVAMVGRLQEVLHDDSLARARVPKNQVRGERPDGDFFAFELKVHLEFLAKQVWVGREPRCEVSGFVPPHRPMNRTGFAGECFT